MSNQYMVPSNGPVLQNLRVTENTCCCSNFSISTSSMWKFSNDNPGAITSERAQKTEEAFNVFPGTFEKETDVHVLLL